MPHELALGSPLEERGGALIPLLLDLVVVRQDRDLRLPYAKLPPLQGIAVATCSFARQVELEPRPVEARRLPDSLDVRLLESEDHAQATEYHLGWLSRLDEGYLERRELGFLLR